MLHNQGMLNLLSDNNLLLIFILFPMKVSEQLIVGRCMQMKLNKNANIDPKGFNSPTIWLPSFLDRVHHPHGPIPKTYLKGRLPKI